MSRRSQCPKWARRASATGLLLLALGCDSPGGRPRVADVPPEAEQHYYAIETRDQIFGYSHVVSYPSEVEGRPITLQRQKTLLLLSVLDIDVRTEIDNEIHIDPATGMYFFSRATVNQGDNVFTGSVRIENDRAHISSTIGTAERTVDLPADVVLPGSLYFPHLSRDFGRAGAERGSYTMLDVRDAVAYEVVYTKLGEERIELAGRTYDAVILEEHHVPVSIKLKVWFDRKTGQILKGDLPNERKLYLTEPRVVRKIQVADLDDDLIARVGIQIADYQAISYMKVRAVLEPTGLRPTIEGLNVPGQTFTGTVTGNRIEGVFEIRHPRFDGRGAPPFPADFSHDDSLRRFLEPSDLIESTDPVLVQKARELTEGATDAWDAAQRVSRWVTENIRYDIPGGGTARRTYDLRAGECGSHSALVAALCRAAGIPARIVWGCQYIPSYGGAFGQHGWNEVYMGDSAGWVPIDSTAHEPDYVDSGHIRVDRYRSGTSALNPVEFEILEYALADGEVIAVERTEPEAGTG